MTRCFPFGENKISVKNCGGKHGCSRSSPASLSRLIGFPIPPSCEPGLMSPSCRSPTEGLEVKAFPPGGSSRSRRSKPTLAQVDLLLRPVMLHDLGNRPALPAVLLRGGRRSVTALSRCQLKTISNGVNNSPLLESGKKQRLEVFGTGF